MFPTYNSLAEVPEAFREHYVMKGGKAVAEVANDHPLVTNNATLLNEKTAAETKAAAAESKAQSLQADLDSAKASSLPRGHVAVPKADAELLEKVKPLGTADEIKAKLDEHATLKRETALRAVADSGYSFAALKDFDDVEGGLTYVPKEEAKDGKTVKVWHVKDGDKERPLDDYAKEKRPALASILRENSEGRQGKPYVSQSAGGKTPEGEDFIAKRNKERDAQRASNPNPLMPKTTTAAAAT